jgi:hypothetical protein
MANATNITYGAYDFQVSAGPVPLLTIKKDFRRLATREKLGSFYTATLRGELNRVPDGVEGIVNVDSMQDALTTAFSTDCLEFKVVCGATTLISQYPRVKSITFSESRDQWAQTCPYTIELEWDGELLNGCVIESIVESWDLQLYNGNTYYTLDLPGGTGDNNMNLFSLSHNISAKGLMDCDSSDGHIPWEHARDYVVGVLSSGVTTEDKSASGVLNLDGANLSGWNHSRVQRIDKTDGHFHVDETWVLANTGLNNNIGAGIEDFTANVQYDAENGLTSVAINGTIEGLEDINYGTDPGDYTVNITKYENASGFWEGIQPKLYGRASVLAGTTIHPTALNYSVGHNPTKGSISYNYTFNNRPCNFVSNALVEKITISDDHPVDVFAEIAILGRAYGPLLQDIGTVTSSKRTVNISVVMGPTTGCDITGASAQKPNVDSILCSLYQDISGAQTQLFKNQDQESWDIKTGQYSRTVQWTYSQCSGTAPVTTFC